MLLASWVALSAQLAQAALTPAPPAVGALPAVDEDRPRGFIAVTEGTIDCLRHSSVRECTGQDNPTHASVSSDSIGLDERLRELQAVYWRDRLVDPTTGASTPTIGIGVSVDEVRLDEDEILADPDKVWTDRNEGGEALWIRSRVELRPELNIGMVSAQNLGFTGSVSVTHNVRILRRYLISEDYDRNFWNRTREELRLIVRRVPLFIRLPLTYRDESLLPGEEVEIERFSAVSLFLGASFNVLGTPGAYPIGIGIGVSAGLSKYWLLGHYRTHVHRLANGNLRVILERARVNGRGLYGSIGPQINLGFLNFQLTLGRLGVGRTVTHDTLTDMVFDLRHPEAQQALARAYGGDFTLAQELDLGRATAGYHGVSKHADYLIDQTLTERAASFLLFEKSSSIAHAVEKVRVYRPNGGYTDLTQDAHVVHKLGKGLHKKRELTVSLRRMREAETVRLEFEVKDSSTSPGELRDLLAAAVRGGPPEAAARVSEFLGRHARGSTSVRARFVWDLDREGIEGLLNGGRDAETRYFLTCRELLGENPTPGLSRLMRVEHAKRVGRILRAAQGERDPARRAQRLVELLRNANLDPLPLIALMATANPADTGSFGRLTSRRGGGRETVHWARKGETFSSFRSLLSQPLDTEVSNP